MYCRTHNLRLHLCDKYDIKPIGRFKLLNGRSVTSDTGAGDITDEYIIFDCVLKNDNSKRDTIFCGTHVANDFCKIIGCKLPTLFDPLHHEHTSAQPQASPHITSVSKPT